MLEEDRQRVLLIPDELHGWVPTPESIGEDHPVLNSEATFRDTLTIARHLAPRRTVLTHIEEPGELSHDDGKLLEEKLRAEGFDVTFAYDSLRVDV